jgi:hypothetical protein
MANLWSADFGENRTRLAAELFPVQVVLRDDQWYTIAMRTPFGAALQEPAMMPGQDVGGVIHLQSHIHKEIAGGDLITSYAVGRRGLKAMDRMKLMANDDEFRRKPADLKGIKYEVVISFKTDAEAVSFALLFAA